MDNNIDILFITPSRIIVRADSGGPAWRKFGAAVIYVSEIEPLTISFERQESFETDFIIVPPQTPHLATTENDHVTMMLLEQESINFEATVALLTGPGVSQDSIAENMRQAFAGFDELLCHAQLDIDSLFFSNHLPMRKIDSRIERVIHRIIQDVEEELSAEDCAKIANLSFSRFIHLFREEIGDTYRSFRAWKRARRFMPFANKAYNLADVAQQIGYSDAPHFSRSIRHVWGMTPRKVNTTLRDYRVVIHDKELPLPPTTTSIRK